MKKVLAKIRVSDYTLGMKNETQIKITEGMKVRVSGRIMKVKSIKGDVCTMLHENGCLPARDSDRFKDLGFLMNYAKPV
jgi:hypothetical protein